MIMSPEVNEKLFWIPECHGKLRNTEEKAPGVLLRKTTILIATIIGFLLYKRGDPEQKENKMNCFVNCLQLAFHLSQISS